MSFWDTLKPAPIVPKAIEAALTPDGKTLELVWDDGRRSSVAVRVLRQQCPCAECVDEWSGQRTLLIDKVPIDLTAGQLSQVGNYAVSFVFGDKHRTGIFNWELLRALSAPPAAK